MSTLQKQIERTLLPGMHLPEPLALLFGWIEGKGYFIDRDNRRIGFLARAGLDNVAWQSVSDRDSRQHEKELWDSIER